MDRLERHYFKPIVADTCFILCAMQGKKARHAPPRVINCARLFDQLAASYLFTFSQPSLDALFRVADRKDAVPHVTAADRDDFLWNMLHKKSRIIRIPSYVQTQFNSANNEVLSVAAAVNATVVTSNNTLARLDGETGLPRIVGAQQMFRELNLSAEEEETRRLYPRAFAVACGRHL